MLRGLGGCRGRAGGLVVAVAVGADHRDHAEDGGLREDDDGSHGGSFFCSCRQDEWEGPESNGAGARDGVIAT